MVDFIKLQGTHAERGFQQGDLLKDKIQNSMLSMKNLRFNTYYKFQVNVIYNLYNHESDSHK